MNNVEIGIFIKELLQEKGMSNRDLINELEKRHVSMSEANMSNFLNGKHGTNVENYLEIAGILGITVDEVLKAELSKVKDPIINIDAISSNEITLNNKSRKMYRHLWKLIVFFISIALILTISYQLKDNDEINYGSSDLIDYTSSKVIKEGDWIYYCNPSDNYSIYKMKNNQEDKTKISDSSCAAIFLEGEWIYFTKRIFYFDNEGKETSIGRYSSGIHRVRLDGTEEEELYRGVEESDLNIDSFNEHDVYMRQIFKLQVSNNWIYYLSMGKGGKYNLMINRMRIDGSDKETVLDKTAMFVVKGDWIYYIGADNEPVYGEEFELETSIYKVMIDGTNGTKIGGDNAMKFIVGKNSIYYVADKFGVIKGDKNEAASYNKKSSIHKVNFDGTEDIILVDSIRLLESLDIKGEMIYYSTSSGIYSVKIDGSNKKILLNHNIPFEGIKVIDEWIYFGDDYRFDREGELPGFLKRISIDGEVKEDIN